jgi:hypothetical protein
MRRLRAIVRRMVKWSVVAFALALMFMLVPVAYVELACRGDLRTQTSTPLIADAAFQRPEANSYLTYPEWHIVYAYDGLAQALKTGDEHAFDYASSVAAFWRTTCALMRVADAHGGADGATRRMIHTIGVSFTAEMAAKAAYEETFGRLTAWLRGTKKTPQDEVVATMAADYAAFLRQTPWYKYPFDRETRKLWAAPVNGWMRGWERRLAIGTEFTAKRVYASAIGGAVAATGEATVVIRSVVSGLSARALSGIADVTVVRTGPAGVEIETPRYDRFTQILAEIARRGGTIREIAGNDDIMVTLTVPPDSAPRLRAGTLITRLTRDGFAGDRLLVNVKVADLATLLNANPIGDPGVEHVFDY